ncbi:MAG TPA: DoxX family protein [Burkholderiales bacterium]|nr:DoxX family protein [Burkholderiales bacterium]
MSTIEKTADLIGRILLAAIFLVSGIGKIGGYAGTQAYMTSMGVPGALLPLVIVVEVVGALALIAGYRTRLVALALAVFTLLAAVLFHRAPDQMQQILFMKNLAIAGGMLILTARGAGTWSLDARAAGLRAPGDVMRRS